MANTRVRKPWQSGQYTVYLWEFLFGLLQDPECCSLITWTNKGKKEFRINNVHEIATLWGSVKNRPTMDDKKLLRALRYYYKTNVLRKVKGHKGVYQFLSIPYETEGCSQDVKTLGKPNNVPSLVGSLKHNVTDDNTITAGSNDRLADHCNTETVDNPAANVKSAENKNKSVTDESEPNCLPGLQEYRSRTESSSEYSMSSDSSTKSLEELQADMEVLTTEALDHMTENMAFACGNSDISNHNVEMSDTFDWMKM